MFAAPRPRAARQAARICWRLATRSARHGPPPAARATPGLREHRRVAGFGRSHAALGRAARALSTATRSVRARIAAARTPGVAAAGRKRPARGFRPGLAHAAGHRPSGPPAGCAAGARGRGLGRGLVQALIAQAFQAAAVERLTLRVYRDNAAAVALYRSLGFEPVDAASTPTLLFMQRARR